MHLLQKEFMEKYLCWFAHKEPNIPYEAMVERIVSSTSSYSNVHGVVNDNSNPDRSMMINAIRMNQDYACECSIVD